MPAPGRCPEGCCWQLACVRNENERAATRRALLMPQSSWTCPLCRPETVSPGRGMGRYNLGHPGGGGGVTPRASLTPPDQPMPSEAGFMTAVGLAVGAVCCATLGVVRSVVAAVPLRPACAAAPQRCKAFSHAQ